MPSFAGTVRAATLASLVAAVTFTVVVQPAATATAVAATPPPGPIAAPPMGWNSWNRFGCDIDET